MKNLELMLPNMVLKIQKNNCLTKKCVYWTLDTTIGKDKNTGGTQQKLKPFNSLNNALKSNSDILFMSSPQNMMFSTPFTGFIASKSHRCSKRIVVHEIDIGNVQICFAALKVVLRHIKQYHHDKG